MRQEVQKGRKFIQKDNKEVVEKWLNTFFCSYRGLRMLSTVHNSQLIPVPKKPLPFSGLLSMAHIVVYRYTCSQNRHTDEKNLKKYKSF